MPHAHPITAPESSAERPTADADPAPLHLALPKGRMHDQLVKLLADAGVTLGRSARGYRPSISLPAVEVKILKPQNIVRMLESGTRDIGFAGADWVAEFEADIVEVLDLGLDPVRVVIAAPRKLLVSGASGPRLPTAEELGRPLRVAGEMERLALGWMQSRGWIPGQNARFVRTYGATEVFPPEDADCVIDITQSGATLEANDLEIVDEVTRSSTRLYASRGCMDDPARRARVDDLAMILSSVLSARGRVMLEVNVATGDLDRIVDLLPCMREPTIAQLHRGAGYAVKAAVPRDRLAELIPAVKAAGGTDLVISPLAQVVS